MFDYIRNLNLALQYKFKVYPIQKLAACSTMGPLLWAGAVWQWAIFSSVLAALIVLEGEFLVGVLVQNRQ